MDQHRSINIPSRVASCRTLAKNEQSRHQYIYPIRERNIRKPNKGKEQGLATRESRYGSRLREGKVLAPLAPIVLDGIHLCLFLSKGCVLCLCLYANECKKKYGEKKEYLQVCSFKPRYLMPTYPFQESERRSSAP